MSNVITRTEQPKSWLQPANAQEAMALATTLSKSNLVPKSYQGKPDDCMVALIVAQEKGLSIWDTFQNLFVIEGRTGWDSKFIIQSINNSGVLQGRLQFKIEKVGTLKIPKRDAVPYKAADPNAGRPYAQKAKPERPEMSIEVKEYTAWGIEASTGNKLEGPTISIKTAMQAQWVDRNPDQWLGDTDNMCMLRAAKRFSSMFGIGIGEMTIDEVRDAEVQADFQPAQVIDSQPLQKVKPIKTPTRPAAQESAKQQIEEVKAESVDSVTADRAKSLTADQANNDAEFQAMKAEHVQLSGGDADWMAAIEAATTIADLQAAQEAFDL